jgi:dihydrofolate reductase
MQAPGGADEDRSGGFAHGGWLEPVGDEALNNQIGTLFSGEYDLLLGRRTFEIFGAYWPFMPVDDPIASGFARARKYVLSHHPLTLDWDRSERLADFDALAHIRAGDGPDIIIQGSSTLYPELLARGLLDRLVLMIAPVTLGSGKRLLSNGTPPVTMKLIEQRIGAGGMLTATYEPAGPVASAPAGPEITSEPELKRRAAVAAGEW